MGFFCGWTYDHIFWRTMAEQPWFSATPVLTAAAAATSQLRIGLMVGSPNFRHPVTLVKDSLALDDISGGRFVLGVGAGAVSAGDAEVLGGPILDKYDRAERFAEFVQLSSELLDNRTLTKRGRFFSAQDARMIPGSTQAPRLPLAVAASGRKGIDLAAHYGDAWITAGPANWLGNTSAAASLELITRQRQLLDERLEEHGRTSTSFRKVVIATPAVGNPLESVDTCRRLLDTYSQIGFDEFVLHWPQENGIYAGKQAVLEDIAAAVLPDYQKD